MTRYNTIRVGGRDSLKFWVTGDSAERLDAFAADVGERLGGGPIPRSQAALVILVTSDVDDLAGLDGEALRLLIDAGLTHRGY